MHMGIDWLNHFRNRPIREQLLFIFISFILLIGLTFVFIIPVKLNSFFTNEMFKSIEEAQGLISSDRELSSLKSEPERQTIRSVQHLFFEPNGTFYRGEEFSANTLRILYNQAVNQEEVSKRYVLDVNGEEMLYVISKRNFNGIPIYQVSYLWDAYRKEVVSTLLRQIYLIFFLILIGGIVLSFFLSNWFVKPLMIISNHVKHIAKKKWDHELQINRKDEIGTLAESIEMMRKQLKTQDETQQKMLQHISHDLKTPVMVIRSYADSLKEGLYPAETLEGTADIIEKEAVKLEKKIGDLLYLTKLDYLATKGSIVEDVRLKAVIEQVIKRLHSKRLDVNISLQMADVIIKGDREQWTIFFENLIDNFLKYAKSHIILKVEENNQQIVGTFFNDGEPIDEDILQHLFKPYVKGKKGHYGLGLAIMNRIAELHKAKLSARNIKNGVEFNLIWLKNSNRQ